MVIEIPTRADELAGMANVTSTSDSKTQIERTVRILDLLKKEILAIPYGTAGKAQAECRKTCTKKQIVL